MAAVGSSLKSIALRADAIGISAYELFSPGRDAPGYKAHGCPVRDEFTRGGEASVYRPGRDPLAHWIESQYLPRQP